MCWDLLGSVRGSAVQESRPQAPSGPSSRAMGSASSVSPASAIQSIQPPAAASAVASAVASAAAPLISKHLGELGLLSTKDSSINLVQLLRLAHWQLSSGADTRKMLCSYFLILAAKKTLSQTSLVKFAKLFAGLGPEIVPGLVTESWSELREAADDRELDEMRVSESKLASLEGHLQAVCMSVLESDWKPDTWHVPESSKALGFREEALPMLMKKADPVMRALTGRCDETKESTAAPESGQTAKQVAMAVPFMIQVSHSCRRLVQLLEDHVHPLFGEGSLQSNWLVESCKFVIPAGRCPLTGLDFEQDFTFSSFGLNLLDRLRVDVASLDDTKILQELGDINSPCRSFTTNSRSGAIFLTSCNGSFIVKTISRKEAMALMDAMPKYVQRMCGDRVGSMLGRYLALFRLNFGGLLEGSRYITIMQSIMDPLPQLPLLSLYDLKGCAVGRHVSDVSTEFVRKDQNWLDDGERLQLCADDALRLRQMHDRDTTFLSMCNIMDYSILVGIGFRSDDTSGVDCGAEVLQSADGQYYYFVGIIDFLVEYGLTMRLYHLLKHEMRGMKKKDCVVIDPDYYAERQRKFLREVLLDPSATCGDVDSMLAAEIASLPPPCHDEDLWIASCRPPVQLDLLLDDCQLYQPDCRHFCEHGQKCELFKAQARTLTEAQRLKVQAHCDFFLHPTGEAAKLSKIHEASCRNKEGFTAETWGAYEYWSIDGSEGSSDFPCQLNESRVLVYVHGFRTPFHRAMSFLYLLQQRLRMETRGDLAAVVERTNVIGFLWPSHKTSYPGARAKIPGAAVKLHALLQRLHSNGCTVTVVGHSLGARVALSAVRTSIPETIVDHMFLLGAAIHHNALSSTGDFPREALAVRSITNFFSKNDAVLAGAFGLAELSSGGPKREAAMGFCGISEPLPDGCASYDVSSTVPSHNADDYILSPPVMSAVVAAASKQGKDMLETSGQAEAFLSSARLLRSESLQEEAREDAASLSDEGSGAEGPS